MPILYVQMMASGLLFLASASLASAVPAQPSPSGPSTSLFQQVVPQPSGKNGYELLLLAADAFKGSKFYLKAQEPGTSLAFKRDALADRQVVRALKLLHDGLGMPIASPRGSVSFLTLLPELPAFRGLSRLLVLQQYVLLADGRVAAAVANARLGLRFSQAIQTDTLVSGLMGVAIGTACIDPLARHLDQLSEGDCATLFQTCQEWLAQPNPQLRIISSDWTNTMGGVEELKRKCKQEGAIAAAQELPDNETLLAVLKELPAAPDAVDLVFADVAKRMNEHFGRVLKEMEKLPWERKPLRLDESDLAGRLAAALAPAYEKVDERYTRVAARVRLMACHCAIHRFRWEYDRLPPSLNDLGLGELSIDPFTGQPWQYVVRGARYSLSSAGSTVEPGDPQAVNGRIPVSITPGD